MARINPNLLPDGQRCCTGCNAVYPNTSEYFYLVRRDGTIRTMARCKHCINFANANYRRAYPDKHRAWSRDNFRRKYQNDPDFREAKRAKNRRGRKLRALRQVLPAV